MSRDYLKAAAMVAALVTMAAAEYQLAAAAGFGRWLAAGLRASLDIYTLRAIRAHREVLASVAVTIVVNAVSHLVAVGLVAVSWPVVVAVSALPVLVLWRVHALPEHAARPPAVTLTAEPVPPDGTGPGEPVPAVPPQPRGAAEPPVWGPVDPLAELLPARTGTAPELGEYRLPAEPVPAPVPPVPPVPDESPEGVFAARVALVRAWLADEPDLTGTAIGQRLGTGDSYGRRLRRAALEPVPVS
jgi:hypothetical protein